MLVKAFSIATAVIIFCSASATGQDALLRLENRAQDTAQQLPHPLGVCDQVGFGPADHAFVTPPQENRMVAAVLYPSHDACVNRVNRIAVVPPNEDTPIGDGQPVVVGAVRMDPSPAGGQ